jgi:gluconokinase
MNVTGLRSPYEKIGGIRYFARLLDKIRLNIAETLPKDYQQNLGTGFDGRAVNFLWVEYPKLVERVKKGGADEEILQWCFDNGRKPTAEDIEIWNEFMRKRGWNDEGTETLGKRLKEGGFEERGDIQTFFDFIDLDEGRDPAKKAG